VLLLIESSGLMLLMAFLLGVVSGLRAFTAPAMLWIVRHGGTWAYILLAGAILEFFFDVHPRAPRRTRSMGLVTRLISGAFVGWWVAIAVAKPVAGMVAGIAGALVGAYGGLALRTRAAMLIGNEGAGLLEDSVAVVLALVVVSQL
jgi:uncharacterized membrane protein